MHAFLLSYTKRVHIIEVCSFASKFKTISPYSGLSEFVQQADQDFFHLLTSRRSKKKKLNSHIKGSLIKNSRKNNNKRCMTRDTGIFFFVRVT